MRGARLVTSHTGLARRDLAETTRQGRRPTVCGYTGNFQPGRILPVRGGDADGSCAGIAGFAFLD